MDFPFCFAAVRFLGAEKVGHYEHVVVEAFKGAVGTVLPSVQEEQFKDETNSTTDSSKDNVDGSTVEKKLDEGASMLFLHDFSSTRVVWSVH